VGSHLEISHDLCSLRFTYLVNQPERVYWNVPRSLSHVVTKGEFQRQAKNTAAKCHEAINEEKEQKTVESIEGISWSPIPVGHRTGYAAFRAGCPAGLEILFGMGTGWH
jgi:hypothetical protein